jgi:cell division septal protein FtsQ
MGSEKRARQKQNRQARLEAERRADRRAKWRRRIVNGLVIAAILVVVFVIGNLVTGGDQPADPAPVQPSVTDVTTPDG